LKQAWANVEAPRFARRWKFLVQMASALGIRSLQHQLRRGFRKPKDFDVRYWTPAELLGTFHAVLAIASATAASAEYGFGTSPYGTPIAGFWRDMVCPLMTQSGHQSDVICF
jgi:hypothetical protein